MPRRPAATLDSPFETAELYRGLATYLNTEVHDPVTARARKIGDFKWGVYVFYDYDGEPIYVGQTNEKLRTRIRRHLTNQRTDAVAMSVLDPFEVLEIEVWPLPEFQECGSRHPDAKAHLNTLEHMIYERVRAASRFGAILNEKNPPVPQVSFCPSAPYRAKIISEQVYHLRKHPDSRLARRALTISRLAQVISEREVQGGLRRVLVTQAKRLEWLAEQRFQGTGGERSVEAESDTDTEEE